MKSLTQLYEEHKISFSKAALTSFAATVIDFSTLYVFVEYVGMYYVYATALGACVGAVTNFTLNKYWAFENKGLEAHVQGLRYVLVSAISLCLNTFFVFFFTEFAHIQYLTSKIISSICVGWGWNYPLHRYFVFPKNYRKPNGT